MRWRCELHAPWLLPAQVTKTWHQTGTHTILLYVCKHLPNFHYQVHKCYALVLAAVSISKPGLILTVDTFLSKVRLWSYVLRPYFFLLFRWVRYYQCWRHSQATKTPYWDLSWAPKRYMLLEVCSGESDEVLIVCYGQAYTMGKSPNRCYPSSPVLGSRILLVTLYTPLFWHRSKTQQPHKKGYTLHLEPGVWGCYTHPQSITSLVPESICWHTEWLRTALNMYHSFVCSSHLYSLLYHFSRVWT